MSLRINSFTIAVKRLTQNYLFIIVCLIVLVYPNIGEAQSYCSPEVRQELEVAEFDDFYDPLPERVVRGYPRGSVIRYHRLAAEKEPANFRVYRVLYASTMNQVGGIESQIPIATSGLVTIPTYGNGDIKTGLQTLVYTHATVGISSECGPSKRGIGLENVVLYPNVKTVAPDYPGLGYDSGLKNWITDQEFSWNVGLCERGRQPFRNSVHPYVSIEAQGRSAIDIVLASQQLERILKEPCEEIVVNNDFAVVGASQGGHAALAVGELMHKPNPYDTKLNLLSIVAGAPASKLEISDDLAKNRNLPMVLVGYSLEYLDFNPLQYMTYSGMCEYSNHIDRACVGDSSYGMVGEQSPFIYDFPQLRIELDNDTVFQSAVNANTLGFRPIDVPVMIGQAYGDPVITPIMTDELVDNLKKTEPPTNVTYCKYWNIHRRDPKQNHIKILNKMFTNTWLYEGQNCQSAVDFLEENELRISD